MHTRTSGDFSSGMEKEKASSYRIASARSAAIERAHVRIFSAAPARRFPLPTIIGPLSPCRTRTRVTINSVRDEHLGFAGSESQAGVTDRTVHYRAHTRSPRRCLGNFSWLGPTLPSFEKCKPTRTRILIIRTYRRNKGETTLIVL